ncbi:hypothetical protein QBC34DRAFT_413219 [Podospora aff. communis PSN243]|uniref:Uncharacterized protein n=1 Tax=Podospora aff. communis PSN243 TaxID=3040156 RepID=A0AAV9G9E1_9PEZI|nr:hypothetical protein QBC34DRAFT_413219 [Podospora aff. communis PSN243]
MPPERKDVFLIEPTLLASELRGKLMGAIVRDPLRPALKFEPDDRMPITIVEGMDPVPIPIRDLQQVITTVSEGNFKTNLERLANAYYGTTSSTSTTNTAKAALRYYMIQPEKKLQALVSDRKVFEKIHTMFVQHGVDKPLFFVTQIVTFVNWNVAADVQSGSEGGGGLTIRDATGNVAGGAGLSVNGGFKRGATTKTSGEYENEMIFAMGYHRLRLKKRKGWRAFIARWRSDKRAGYIVTPFFVTGRDLFLEEGPAEGTGRLDLGDDDDEDADPDNEPARVAAVENVGIEVHRINRPLGGS